MMYAMFIAISYKCIFIVEFNESEEKAQVAV